MLLSRLNTKHISTMTHEGKVLIVATVVENNSTKLYYTVKQDGFEDTALQNPHGTSWEAFREILLPNDDIGDPSVQEKEQQDLISKQGYPLMRSIYKSAALSADAPVQLVSHDGHVYLFRQSTSGTLLVDRFVLDGMTNTLTPKIEVRFKRSRQRYKPLENMRINSGGQLESVDALDFRDMEDKSFYEPTLELAPTIINDLANGWFGVVVTPTNELDNYRWHIFWSKSGKDRVSLLTVRAGSEYIFDVKDYWFRSVDPVTDKTSYASIPGLLSREITIQDDTNNQLTIANGLAAVKYDVQREQETENGPQLLRDSSKIMLAIPTNRGIATLAFAIAADGTLAQISERVQSEALRSQEREILLPLNLLDNIRGFADESPAPGGTITGMSRSVEVETADRVRVQVAPQDKAAVENLVSGDLVKLTNTGNYNGLYKVKSVRGGAFVIDAPVKSDQVGNGDVGNWVKVDAEETGLVFDGQITAYEKDSAGKLTVNATNHGLAQGDLVQIVGSSAYDGEYPVLKHDAGSFTIQRLWVNGGAVNVKIESRKRRGLILDGKQDWIEIPLSDDLKLNRGFTLEAWVKLGAKTDQTILATVQDIKPGAPTTDAGWQAVLGVRNGFFSVSLTRPSDAATPAVRLDSSTAVVLQEWVHVAAIYDGKSLQLLVNGGVAATLSADALSQKAHDAKTALYNLLSAQEQELRKTYNANPQDPANYWTRMVLRSDERALTAGVGSAVIRELAGNRPEQLWRLEKQADGWYAIRNKATRKVLENVGFFVAAQQTDWRNVDSQKWRLLTSPTDNYLVRSQKSGDLQAWGGDTGVAMEGYGAGDMLNQPSQEWRLAPVGESLANLAKAAMQDVDIKAARADAVFVFRATGLSVGATGEDKTKPTEMLQGQLSDVRIWTTGRTVQEINNSMYLQLTGRETGLAGYWRLGGVAEEEDGTQRVYDFSVNANHGNVHGFPYAGGILLGRTLRDGKTAVLKYSNDDLFAVREGATYVEGFEFRTDPKISDPNNLIDQKAIFSPSLWGRLVRNSEDKTTIVPSSTNFEFKRLDNDWWSASCRFIVPEGVRLLRCFELSDVSGDWNTLEVQRYRLTLVSDSVTQSVVNETVKLTPLARAHPPGELLRQIGEQERQEVVLVAQVKELQRKLADSNSDDIAAQVKKQELERQKTDKAYAKTKQDYDKAIPTLRSTVDNPSKNREYFYRGDYVDTRMVVCPRGKIVIGLKMYSHPLNKRGGELVSLEIKVANPDGSGREYINHKTVLPGDQEKLDCPHYIDTMPVQVPTGRFVTGVQFYQKRNRLAIKVRTTREDGSDEKWHDDDQNWSDANSSYFHSEIHKENHDVDTNWVTTDPPDKIVTGIWMYLKGDRIAPRIGYYQPAKIKEWDNKLAVAAKNLKDAQDRLKGLTESSKATDKQRDAWQTQISELEGRLATVRLTISSVTTTYLSQAVQANSTVQSMPALVDMKDPHLLAVQGALLPSDIPVTRVQAIESCTGRVTLTYQDSDGALHQTHYDTTYDADGKGEEWMVDKYPVAIELDGTKPPIALQPTALEGLGGQATIEFWSRGSGDLLLDSTILAATNKDNKTVLRIQLPNDKQEVVWEAGAANSKTLDRIACAAEAHLYRERWTHWAFVKDVDQGEMRIYVNGKLLAKNDPKPQKSGAFKQLLSPITQTSIGGTPGPAALHGWQGRIADLRIWNVALGEREIEANSVLTCTGNEPGLVAYYPFNEAQGGSARDQTGRAVQPLDVTAGRWVPCTAPIGRLTPPPIDLLNDKTKFNKDTPFVRLPTLDLDFTEGMTIEARVCFASFKRWSRIVELGNGEYQQNIFLGNFGTGNQLVLRVINDDNHYELLAADPLPRDSFVHIAATIQKDGIAKIYINGEQRVSNTIALPQALIRESNFLGKSNWSADELFDGEMEYVRLYEYVLDAAEIRQHASGLNWNVITAEYSRVRVDAQKRKAVMMLRAVVMPTAEGVRLLDEQRIEELEMKWIGNAQINPTLIGYIEGAPPSPTENLTEEQDYNGATSVDLIQSSDVEYSWTREQDVGLGAEIELLIGVESKTLAGLGVQTSMEEVKSGFGGRTDFAYHWQNASTVGASHSLMSSDRLELRGTQEEDAHFAHLGPRFIPKNIGYAVVTSGLADVFVSKLKRSGRMIGYQVLPVEGVPLDVNTITFLINPAYTMSGSLDGLTGSRATSDRFFQHVPEMRSQYGSLYPASYFRLKEAYDLKAQIDKKDEQHQAYFNQFSARVVEPSDMALDYQVDKTDYDSEPVQVNSQEGKTTELAEIKQKIQSTEQELDTLKKANPVDTVKVNQKQTELDELNKKHTDLEKRKESEQQERKREGEARQDDINKAYADLSTRANASDSFSAWQKKMENLQIRAGKRNIVNTYVWDGDGGFHAEEQQFASTVEHTIGGSYDFSGAVGGQASVAFSKALVELSAYVQFSMTQTMSKTERSSKGLELHVDLSGVESRGITDYRDYPIMPGEKVDRYRFMSFFLENNINHWHDFFNQVVDPEWLASNDEEARALRQTQTALPNKVWRVLHRVTYVERPALMGFGRAGATRDRAADDLRQLRQQVDDLNSRVAVLQKEINDKLDQLLTKK